MPTPLAELLFSAAAAVIVVTQALILRSTRRGMRLGPPGSGSLLEWTFAVVPALCLVATLLWTWRVMHPDTVRVEGRAPAIGVSP
jgi:hypothetical protein